ncbi:MAG: DUF1318 domain-containing protein [Deferrisomatales bacterium]|nr:DUF1318 domain-containing protein [Deferrisomatales bacterium]
MIRNTPNLAAAALLAWTAFGCTLAEVKVDVISERTALENQVLGTYNALDREMLLVASVRGVDSSGELREPPQRSQEHRDSVLAMQTLAFHQDDVDAFARLGWVGEGADGLLAPFELRKDGPEDLREFAQRYGPAEFQSVLARVNDAREQVMARVVALNPDLTAADLPEVHRVFGRLNADNARSGVKIQHPDGSWVVKP